jgi:hypothetical protein
VAQLDPAAVIRPVPGEWHPRMPERLDDEELADWPAGRDAVYQLASVSDALALGEAALGRIGYGGDDARIITDQLIDNSLCGYRLAGLPLKTGTSPNLAANTVTSQTLRRSRHLAHRRISCLMIGWEQPQSARQVPPHRRQTAR